MNRQDDPYSGLFEALRVHSRMQRNRLAESAHEGWNSRQSVVGARMSSARTWIDKTAMVQWQQSELDNRPETMKLKSSPT